MTTESEAVSTGHTCDNPDEVVAGCNSRDSEGGANQRASVEETNRKRQGFKPKDKPLHR